jgi:hypothetical protein
MLGFLPLGVASLGAGGAVKSVSLTGLSSTASTGTVQWTASKAMTGVSSAASSSPLAPKVSYLGAAVTTTETPGSFGLIISSTIALSGLSSTASPGTITQVVRFAPTGVSATLAFGSFAESVARSLSGVASASLVGSLTPTTVVALTGNAAATGLSSFAPLVSKALPSNVGGFNANPFGVGVTESLTGASAASGIGSFTQVVTRPLAGASAAAALGSLQATPGDILDSVSAPATAGSIKAAVAIDLPQAPSITVATGSVNANLGPTLAPATAAMAVTGFGRALNVTLPSATFTAAAAATVAGARTPLQAVSGVWAIGDFGNADTVPMASAIAAPVAGAPIPTPISTLASVVAGTQINSPATSIQAAIPGASAASAVNALARTLAKALPGTAATPATGSFATPISAPLASVQATFGSGIFAPALTEAMASVALTATANSFQSGKAIDLAAVAATASVGSFSTALSFGLAGAETPVQAGVSSAGVTTALTGVSNAFGLGTFRLDRGATLAGVNLFSFPATFAPSMTVPLPAATTTVEAGQAIATPTAILTQALAATATGSFGYALTAAIPAAPVSVGLGTLSSFAFDGSNVLLQPVPVLTNVGPLTPTTAVSVSSANAGPASVGTLDADPGAYLTGVTAASAAGAFSDYGIAPTLPGAVAATAAADNFSRMAVPLPGIDSGSVNAGTIDPKPNQALIAVSAATALGDLSRISISPQVPIPGAETSALAGSPIPGVVTGDLPGATVSTAVHDLISSPVVALRAASVSTTASDSTFGTITAINLSGFGLSIQTAELAHRQTAPLPATSITASAGTWALTDLINAPVPGVEIQAVAGAFAKNRVIALSGVDSGTAQTGSFGYALSFDALPGASTGTAAAGSFAKQVRASVSGVAGTAQLGIFTVNGNLAFPWPSIGMVASAGAPTPSLSDLTIPGAAASAVIGTVAAGPSPALTAVTASTNVAAFGVGSANTLAGTGVSTSVGVIQDVVASNLAAGVSAAASGSLAQIVDPGLAGVETPARAGSVGIGAVTTLTGAAATPVPGSFPEQSITVGLSQAVLGLNVGNLDPAPISGLAGASSAVLAIGFNPGPAVAVPGAAASAAVGTTAFDVKATISSAVAATVANALGYGLEVGLDGARVRVDVNTFLPPADATVPWTGAATNLATGAITPKPTLALSGFGLAMAVGRWRVVFNPVDVKGRGDGKLLVPGHG